MIKCYTVSVKSKRPQQKTRREKKRSKKKVIIVIASTLTIIGTFFYIMNHNVMALKRVVIEGQRTLIDRDIQDTVNNYLSKSYLGIRNDNILFVSVSSIQVLLEEAFPKIQNLSLEIQNGEDLVVIVGERSAHSLWCIDQIYEYEFDEECYFADRAGLLYARAPYFSGNVYMKLYIQPDPENEEYVGRMVDQIESFNQFFAFLEDLEEEYPVAISNIYFDNFDDVRIEISRFQDVLYTQYLPVLLYNQSNNYDRVLRDIGITLGFNDFKKDFKTKAENLESIDVRFDGRIFYTFTPIDSESE